MLLAPDAHNKRSCPIWGGVNLGGLPTTPEEFSKDGNRYYSSRAGGPFRLMQSGADLLAVDTQNVLSEEGFLPVGQRANLSYWIYLHNLENRLLDELTDYHCQEDGPFQNWMDNRRDRVLKLDKAWVEGHWDCTPPAKDQTLTFLRELIRGGGQSLLDRDRNLQMAAGSCHSEDDLTRLYKHALKQEWMSQGTGLSEYHLNQPAYIYVEEQLLKKGSGEQGFVAMWFDASMDEAYKCGIKPAIEAAGYKPQRIDRKRYLGPVADEILAEIRKSRFVVADVTGCKECTACEKCEKTGAPGGVYFEAGFAQALNIPVIYTCHEDRKKTVHFDVDHLYRIEWRDPQDLRENLEGLIVDVLERGPLDPSTERSGEASGESIEAS